LFTPAHLGSRLISANLGEISAPSRLHLGYISAASRLHRGCISAASRLHLACISANLAGISPVKVVRVLCDGLAAAVAYQRLSIAQLAADREAAAAAPPRSVGRPTF